MREDLVEDLVEGNFYSDVNPLFWTPVTQFYRYSSYETQQGIENRGFG